MLKKLYTTGIPFPNYNIKSYWSFLKLTACVMIIPFFSNDFHPHKERPIKNITIFIHGTLMPFLALLNPLKTYTQTLKQKDWYYKCLQALRGDSDLLHDSIILEEGLKKIDPLLLYQCSRLPGGLTKTGLTGKGAYQAIGAYDSISKSLKNLNQRIPNNTSYYTFGFNGILSHSHRKEASLKFYEELNTLVSECLKNGFKPILNLCGYSHGGNVILLLAHAELLFKQNLYIDKVILFGTPIQAETAIYANHPMFCKIYNFFSEGDNVQNSDSFSTSSASSYRTFKEVCQVHNLEILAKNIYDIRLLVSENAVSLGHFSYWFFSKYSDSWISTQPSNVQSVLNSISPWPIAIFTPLFLDLIEQHESLNMSTMEINFRADDQLLEIELRDNQSKLIGKSDNIYPLVNKIKRYTSQLGLKTDSSSSITSILLKNLGASISTIFQSLIR